MGMDVTLEANVKASIDQLYREIRVPSRQPDTGQRLDRRADFSVLPVHPLAI